MNEIKTNVPKETIVQSNSVVIKYNPGDIKPSYESIEHYMMMNEMSHKLAER